MNEPRGDTIAASATASGAAAVAIVRLSGPRARAIARRVTGIDPRPRYAELCHFLAVDGTRIDRGLVLFFPAPHSYTGEDVVELQGHGGRVVPDWLLETVFACGARPAEPGEFTLRAFLNDKLDLAQAEAVADLVASGTRRAARAALRSLSGRFSDAVADLQAELTAVRVHVEAWLDFPDEEIDRDTSALLASRVERLESGLRALLGRAAQGAALHDGLTVVIAGPPNVGKSSLLNRLAGYDAAIVTEVPGTTRDTLREHLSIDGLPVSVADTAGLRRSTDRIEAEGVRRAQLEIARADRILWVAEAGAGAGRAVAAARGQLGADASFTVLLNKSDLLGEPARACERDGVPVLLLSALTGDGVELLTAHLKRLAGLAGNGAGTFSARRRHVAALERAAGHLAGARAELDAALEVGAEELRAAQAALGELTGELTTDDLLCEIFSSFCIGK